MDPSYKVLMKALIDELMADDDFLKFVEDKLDLLVKMQAVANAQANSDEIAKNLIFALEERGCAPRIRDGKIVGKKDPGPLQAALDVYRPHVLRVLKTMQADSMENQNGTSRSGPPGPSGRTGPL